MDMDNNTATKYCWDTYKPSYSLAATCAHMYISANTQAEIERQRQQNKTHPFRCQRPYTRNY